MGLSNTIPKPVIPTAALRGWKAVMGAAGGTGPGLAPKGAIWFVDSSNPAALDSGGNPLSPGPRNQGTDPATPFASLNFAIGGTVASNRTPSGVRSNNGDVIIVMPGHVEAIGATPITMALSGVTVIFLGNEQGDRAQISLNNTAAQFLITGANNHFVGMMVVTGIDAVVAGVQVQGSGNYFEDVEYVDVTSKSSLIQLLTTAAGATRLKIRGYRYYEPATIGTAKTEAIRIVGGRDLELEDICIRGNFSTGTFNNITTAFLNAKFTNCILDNTNATPHVAMAVLVTSTGSGRSVLLVVASGSTFITASNIIAFDINSSGNTPGGTPVNIL